MDKITQYLATYSADLKYEAIPSDVVHKAKALLLDTVGCAIGGYSSEPAKMARLMAGRINDCWMPATIIGSGAQSSLELATFANGVMLRYLDINDGFDTNKMGAHPSDNFGPILTCADAAHINGKDLITAIVLAYEVYCRLGDCINPADRGFDHAVATVISSTVAISRLLGLTPQQTEQALNLAIAPNMALGQTRVGEISMWKACATAHAARNAVVAALLAKEGMTGPSPIFEGRHGMFEVVTGPFRLDPFGGDGRPFRIMDANMKRYPCCQLAQTAVDAAAKLASKLHNTDDIVGVKVATFNKAKDVMASEPEKWHPKTRETADHSMPYVVAVALMYGTLGVRHFNNDYLNNALLVDLMQKIQVEETEEYNKLHPGSKPNRVDVITTDGAKLSEFVKYHHGHHLDPFTDQEIQQKFHSLCGELLSPTQENQLFSLVWNLEEIQDTSIILKLLKI